MNKMINSQALLRLRNYQKFGCLSWWIISMTGVAVIFLPFDDLPYLKSMLHEMASEASFYPMSLSILLWIAYLFLKGRIVVPRNKSFLLLYLFIFWTFVSTICNFYSISFMIFKGRSAFSKNMLQIALLLYMALIPILIYDISHSKRQCFFDCFKKCALLSFLIVSIYSIPEILFLLKLSDGRLLLVINRFIHHSPGLYYGRLRSVSGEASWFGMYCGFIFPWIFGYLFSKKTSNRWQLYLTSGYFFVLVVMTFSRTAYFVTLVEAILFLSFVLIYGSNRDKKIAKKAVVFLCFTLIIWYLIFPESLFTKRSITRVITSIFTLNDQVYGLSNIARLGSQTAALKIAIFHPICGVGLGQYGFYMPNYVPNWATISPEIQRWMSKAEGTPWPPVHCLYARIICELGFVGLLFWLGTWLYLLKDIYKKIKIESIKQERVNYIGLSLWVCLVGMLINGLNIDSFRFFGYWIALGMGWAYIL